jgi:hypothetical protein
MPNAQLIEPTQEEQDAYRLLFDNIHGPVFLEKLAEYGIEPQNEDEMTALLQMGVDLMRTERLAQQKQASARGSFIVKAAQSLGTVLAERGLAPQPTPAEDQMIKAAAYRLAKDPKIQQATIAYQDYLARQQAG